MRTSAQMGAKMSIKFNKATLMSGDDFQLTTQIRLHHPTINEILLLGNGIHCEDFYWSYVQSLICDPYSHMIMLEDLGKNFMETTAFEVFILQWKHCQELYLQNKEFYDSKNANPLQHIFDALNFFICGKREYLLSQYEDGTPCIIDQANPSFHITKEVFEYLCDWVTQINKIDYSGRIKPADENARKILIEDTRDELKKRKKKLTKESPDTQNYIGNLLSAVSFGGNGSINPFNIKNCKIYWILEAFSIDSKKSNASHILDGLYHGTLSMKNINQKELNWAN